MRYDMDWRKAPQGYLIFLLKAICFLPNPSSFSLNPHPTPYPASWNEYLMVSIPAAILDLEVILKMEALY